MQGVPDFDGLLDYGFTEDDVGDLGFKWRKLNNEAYSLAASNAAKRYSLKYQLNKKEEVTTHEESPPINGYQLHLIEQVKVASSEKKKSLVKKVTQQRALLNEKAKFLDKYPSYKRFQYEDQGAYTLERTHKWLEQGQSHSSLFNNKYVLGVWAYVIFLPPLKAASVDPILTSVNHNPIMINETMTGTIFEKYSEYRSAFNTFEHFCIWRVKNRIADFKKGLSQLKEDQMPSEAYRFLYNVHLPYRELLQKVLYLNGSDDDDDFNTAIHFVKNILRLSYLDQASGQRHNIRPWIRFFEKLFDKVKRTHIFTPKYNYQGPLFFDASFL